MLLLFILSCSPIVHIILDMKIDPQINDLVRKYINNGWNLKLKRFLLIDNYLIILILRDVKLMCYCKDRNNNHCIIIITSVCCEYKNIYHTLIINKIKRM